AAPCPSTTLFRSDQASQGRATLQLGLVAHHAGEQTKAVSHLLAARDLLRRTDDRAALAKALEQLAATLIPLGSQPGLIEESLDQALALRRALEDLPGEAALRSQRSGFLLGQGRLEAAREEAEQLATLAQRLDDFKLQARAAEQRGDIALRLGQPDAAV